jgi:hypothetical protein
MQRINALSLAPDARDWLANSRHPCILHIFDRACNLINEHREVLSIVTSQVGNGPFNLVVESEILFTETLNLNSPISSSPSHLTLGNLAVRTGDAELWSPRPNWERLHARKEDIANQLTKLPITNYQFCGLNTSLTTNIRNSSTTIVNSKSLITDSQSLISNLSSALVAANLSSAQKITSQLAGLGAGLTPAGDDFILGAIYAAWIIHPLEIASALAQEIANTAAPLTTSLSAAWLRSAGNGEAGIVWHEFFNALAAGNISAIQLQMTKILSFGHTSGADALAGFVGSFTCWVEMLNPPP